MTKQRVLIPLDGSDFSRRILSCVRQFIDSEDSELVLLRVTQPPEGLIGAPARPATTEVPTPVYESERDAELAKHPIYASQAWESLEARLMDELQADALPLREAGYTVSLAVRFGAAGQEIVDFVEHESIDLVAMTTHGRTGLNRLVFGSVAEKVLRNVYVPVMLVRPFERPADT